MKKKLAALLLCIWMMAGLAVPMAGADADVYFTAAGSNILSLSDETMPFQRDGYLYVSSSIFTGLVWKTLSVGHIPANSSQPLILYAGNDQSLMFEVGAGYAYDLNGKRYTPGAVEQNGQVCVPVQVVASYFGLEQSSVSVAHGKLLWLRKPGFGLTDREFSNAAVYSMEQTYAEYLKNRQSAADQAGNGPGGADSSSGRDLYLCMQAGTSAGALLDALDQSKAKAAFFCDPDYLEANGDTLRRMTAEGHAVGLLADTADEKRTVEEQLSQGNAALYRATCTKTRLVLLQNETPEARENAERAGYHCLSPELDRSAYSLRSADNAETLRRRIAARQEDTTTVWLGDTVSGAGLRAFLSAASGARFPALTELA